MAAAPPLLLKNYDTTALEHFIKRYSPENRVKPQKLSQLRHSSDTIRESLMVLESQGMIKPIH
jgi:transcriptional regulator of heat shock response